MKYNKRVFLNPEDSASTGSIVCFDGDIEWRHNEKPRRNSFIEIADCHVKARLHRCYEDRAEDYIEKVKKMRDALGDYLDHLQTRL